MVKKKSKIIYWIPFLVVGFIWCLTTYQIGVMADKAKQSPTPIPAIELPEYIEREVSLYKKLNNYTPVIKKMELTFYAPLDPNAVEGMCYSGDPTITASGALVVPGITVATAPDIPFGTVVWIEGYGLRIAQDRGGGIKGDRIDVVVQTRREAFERGRQTRTVIIFYQK